MIIIFSCGFSSQKESERAFPQNYTVPLCWNAAAAGGHICWDTAQESSIICWKIVQGRTRIPKNHAYNLMPAMDKKHQLLLQHSSCHQSQTQVFITIQAWRRGRIDNKSVFKVSMKTKKEKTKIGMLTFIYLAARVVRWNIVLTKKKNNTNVILSTQNQWKSRNMFLRCKILSQEKQSYSA